MRSVEPGQNWGVTAAANPGSGPAVKNGWLPDGSSGGLWVINSIGVLRHQALVLAAIVLLESLRFPATAEYGYNDDHCGDRQDDGKRDFQSTPKWASEAPFRPALNNPTGAAANVIL